MTTYLVTVENAEGNDILYTIMAKSQREAAADVLNTLEVGVTQAKVYTLAKGSPVSTFRRRTETVTTIERVT